jgi:hypothetical protein
LPPEDGNLGKSGKFPGVCCCCCDGTEGNDRKSGIPPPPPPPPPPFLGTEGNEGNPGERAGLEGGGEGYPARRLGAGGAKLARVGGAGYAPGSPPCASASHSTPCAFAIWKEG